MNGTHWRSAICAFSILLEGFDPERKNKRLLTETLRVIFEGHYDKLPPMECEQSFAEIEHSGADPDGSQPELPF
jgi:hypothetical protein